MEKCHWDPPTVCIVGMVLMFFLWGFRKCWFMLTKRCIPARLKKRLPLICMAIGVAVDVVFGLSGGAHWDDSIMIGLLSGASAIAMWEAVFKHFLD